MSDKKNPLATDNTKVIPMYTVNKQISNDIVKPFASKAATITTTALLQPPYYPTHIQGTYQLSGKNTGAGQLIAIVDAFGYPSAYSDLYAFCQQFNLPKPNNVTTLSALFSPPASNTFNFMVYKMSSTLQNNTGWSMEQSLDIQWAHVSAPQSPILLVQTKSDSLSDLMAGVQYAVSSNASVVSMSWGMPESSYINSPTYQQVFNKPGVTFVASSGDAIGVYYPSVSPYVVSAGGSTLKINSLTSNGATTYNRNNEIIWYTSTNNAEGCGISKYIPIPAYQVGLTASTTYRCVPDLVSIADPNTGVLVYNTFYSKGSTWFQMGGTSLSAPFLAGIIAAANAVRVGKGKQRFSSTSLLQAMYLLLKSTNVTNYVASIFDVISGTNNGYVAKKGADVPSGVGAPIGDGLITYLANY